MDDDELLRRHLVAVAEMGNLANPASAPDEVTRLDEWGFPLVLNTDLQLRYLWITAWDALQVVASTLRVRASTTALAQVRFILETFGITSWLTEPGANTRARSLGLVISEAREQRTVISGWGTRHVQPRAAVLEMLKGIEAEAKARAASEKIQPQPRPNWNKLLGRAGLSYTPYAFLSEIGSHAGLASSLLYSDEAQRTVNVDMAGGKCGGRSSWASRTRPTGKRSSTSQRSGGGMTSRTVSGHTSMATLTSSA